MPARRHPPHPKAHAGAKVVEGPPIPSRGTTTQQPPINARRTTIPEAPRVSKACAAECSAISTSTSTPKDENRVESTGNKYVAQGGAHASPQGPIA